MNRYSLIYFITIFSSIEACDVNYTILDMNAKALASQISGGAVICKKDIERNLDFALPSTKSLISDKHTFSKLTIDEKITITTRVKFGHNRFGTFISESKTLYETATAPAIKDAIFTLCESVTSEIIKMIELYGKDVEEDSFLPDEQLSFFVNTAHLTSGLSDDEDKSISTSSSKSDNSLESDEIAITSQKDILENDISIIDLSINAFSKRSSIYYTKQLERAKPLIQISCNLQYIKMNQIDELQSVIKLIDSKYNLMQIIFMNGSSKKFKVLFVLLKELSESHKISKKPITIVYSTTSDTQKSCNKLYTLGDTHPTLLSTIVIGGTSSMEEIRKKSVIDPQIIETDFSKRCPLEFLLGISPYFVDLVE